MSSSTVLQRVNLANSAVLDRLWQFYELESSFWSHEDMDPSGRFTSLTDSGFMDRLGDPASFDWAYIISHGGSIAGFLLVGHQNLYDRPIMEFADLYVLPKFRRSGIAAEVIRQVVLTSNHPWLICVFRDDHLALSFWERAFKRLPFSSVREIVPPDAEEFRQFVVNEEGEEVR